MVVREPEQEEKTRQTPRLEGGEARGVERERNGAKRPEARASADGRECGLPVEGPNPRLYHRYKFTLVIEHRETVWTARSGLPARAKSPRKSTGGLTRQSSIRGRNPHGVISSSSRPENWRTTSPGRNGSSTFQLLFTRLIGRTPTRYAGRYSRSRMPSGRRWDSPREHCTT